MKTEYVTCILACFMFLDLYKQLLYSAANFWQYMDIFAEEAQQLSEMIRTIRVAWVPVAYFCICGRNLVIMGNDDDHQSSTGTSGLFLYLSYQSCIKACYRVPSRPGKAGYFKIFFKGLEFYENLSKT